MSEMIIKDIHEEQLPSIVAFLADNITLLPRFLLLDGEVGNGKTTFSRAFVKYFSQSSDFSSPTYSIVNIYDENPEMLIHHFDLYRVDESDYDWIFEQFDEPDAFFLIEWASLHPELFEDNTWISMTFLFVDERTRDILIKTNDDTVFETLKGLDDVSIIFKK